MTCENVNRLHRKFWTLHSDLLQKSRPRLLSPVEKTMNRCLRVIILSTSLLLLPRDKECTVPRLQFLKNPHDHHFRCEGLTLHVISPHEAVLSKNIGFSVGMEKVALNWSIIIFRRLEIKLGTPLLHSRKFVPSKPPYNLNNFVQIFTNNND